MDLLGLGNDILLTLCEFVEKSDLGNVRLSCRQLAATAHSQWIKVHVQHQDIFVSRPACLYNVSRLLDIPDLARHVRSVAFVLGKVRHYLRDGDSPTAANFQVSSVDNAWQTNELAQSHEWEEYDRHHFDGPLLVSILQDLGALSSVNISVVLLSDERAGRELFDLGCLNKTGSRVHELMYNMHWAGLSPTDLSMDDDTFFEEPHLPDLVLSALSDPAKPLQKFSYESSFLIEPDYPPIALASRNTALEILRNTSDLKRLDLHMQCTTLYPDTTSRSDSLEISTAFLTANTWSKLERLDLGWFLCRAIELIRVIARCSDSLHFVALLSCTLHSTGTWRDVLVALKDCNHLKDLHISSAAEVVHDQEHIVELMADGKDLEGSTRHEVQQALDTSLQHPLHMLSMTRLEAWENSQS